MHITLQLRKRTKRNSTLKRNSINIKRILVMREGKCSRPGTDVSNIQRRVFATTETKERMYNRSKRDEIEPQVAMPN